jgi:hypothetical protein
MMKKHQILTNLSGISLVVALFFMAACGGSKKESQESASEEFDEAAEQIEEEIDRVIVELPPPSEIPFLLMEIGADYDESLLNNIEKADQYNTTTDKMAVNLGIYTADIGYLAAYGQSQKALDYVSKCKTLAEGIGVTDQVGREFVERFEANVDERDSLAAIANEFLEGSNKQLNLKDRETVASLILTGSFVEGLYLATAIVENYPKDLLPEDARAVILVPIVKLILDQEKPLNDLITLLKDLPDQDNEMVKGLVSNLQFLQEKYVELDIEENLQNNRGDLLLQDEALDEITNQAGKIRDYITKID